MRSAQISLVLLISIVGSATAQDVANFSVTPSICRDSIQSDLSIRLPTKTRIVECITTLPFSSIYIAVGPDISWPIISAEKSTTSFEEQMYSVSPALDAGIPFFDVENDRVWLVDFHGNAASYIVSVTGNDPNTFEKKSGFLAVSETLPLKIFDSFGQALDYLINKKGEP